MKMNGLLRVVAAVLILPTLLVEQSAAWGRDGHKMINRLAVEALPKDVPEFLRSPAAIDAMEYYGPEPDDWKSNAELELKASGEPEHFIDLEWADLIGGPLPRKRYDFLRALTYAGKTRTDVSFTPENIGLLPYAADEAYERLKATMRDYRISLKDEIRIKDLPALEHEIVFLAGIMGHWVGDGSQPLHTTNQFNGWTGDNPNGYSTLKTVHSEFESGFVKANVRPAKDVAPLIPAKAKVIDDVFDELVKYIRVSNSKVEELYKLEKAGGFTGMGTPDGKAFADERLAAGATELRDIIYTAWVKSAEPLPRYSDSQKAAKPGE